MPKGCRCLPAVLKDSSVAVPLARRCCAPRVSDAAARPPPPAGVPAYNKTFFCDGTVTKCYTLRTGGFAYDTQRTQCQQFGGDIVFYESMAEQIEVDNYFYSKNSERPAAGSRCM
jgi:hypothetical protein